jgi:hypothetical protein
MPDGVRKLRSTTTGVDEGLSSETSRVFAAAVDPPAKYHWADVVLWQGAWDQPSALCTDWVTAIPPPAVITVSDSHEPDESAGMEGTTTPPAGTANAVCALAPESEVVVMLAFTGFVVVLVKTRDPGDAPAAVLCPVQYHAVDSASGAPTSALGVGVAPTGVGVPRTLTARATPATTTTTTAATRHLRS